ncbi:MAG: endonuclease/exonuclease/phosphatase family protein [Verrucomicrobiota bacterium]
MVRYLAWILLLASTTSHQAVEVRVASFNIGAHLVVPQDGSPAYFDFGIGPAGGIDHDAVRDVLARIDADVVALQEIHTADVSGPASDLDALAASLGFPHVFVCPSASAFDNNLRVVFLSRFPYLENSVIASPSGARDMTRLMPVVRVDVPTTANDPWLIAAHLKSGSAASDMLQRCAEIRRLTNFLTTHGLTTADNLIITGDFNLSDSPRTFTTLPASGLPTNFALGDTLLPLEYFTEPRAYFSNPPVTRILPRQLDGNPATFPASGSAIDLFLTSPQISSRPHRTEIYNSSFDSSMSGLPKSGLPLDSGISAAASDHLAIFGDFELDPAPPYPFLAAGDTVTETFDDFPGTFDPYPWTTTGGNWKGMDDGNSHAVGFRAYGPAADPSLGILTGSTPATATASFINASPTLMRALRISFTAEQWRNASSGNAGLSVELLDGATAIPLPALSFEASHELPDGAVLGGLSAERSAVIRGLAIAPGAMFQLRFTFGPAAPTPAALFVNAFHYDNAGADQGEFIGIVAGPGFTGNFSDIGVVLYNGGDGKAYQHLNFDSANFTRTTTAGNFDHFVAELGSSLQNGPDGIAIVNLPKREVIEFISYEGSFTAIDSIAAGMTSTSIGVVENGSDPVGQSSLGRIGSGGLPGDFSWAKRVGTPARGMANVGQTLICSVAPPQGIAIDNLAVTFLSDSDGDGATDADEWVFGTDPEDAGSWFAVTFEQMDPLSLRLTFPTVLGRNYAVESSIDLLEWSTHPAFSGDGNIATREFPITPEEPERFYRIRATLE